MAKELYIVAIRFRKIVLQVSSSLFTLHVSEIRTVKVKKSLLVCDYYIDPYSCGG